MKICIIGNLRSIHIQRWCDFLINRGHKVSVISPEKYTYKNLKVFCNKTPYSLKYLTDISSIIKTRGQLNQIKPDLINLHYLNRSGLALIFPKTYPFVVSPWGSDIFRTAGKKLKNKIAYTLIFKRADAITTTSQNMKDTLIERFYLSDEKIHNFSWGIDYKLFSTRREEEINNIKRELDIPNSYNIILSNRHVKPNYNIHTIIKSMPLVLRKIPNIIFVFIKGYGDEKYMTQMQNLSKKLKISNNTRFVFKLLSAKEMANYINMSDICISIPSTDQRSSSVIEAMAGSSIPIVSDLGAYNGLIESDKNGFRIKKITPNELAEKVIFCLRNFKQLKDKISTLNKDFVRVHEDFNKQANNMLDVYRKVLKQYKA